MGVGDYGAESDDLPHCYRNASPRLRRHPESRCVEGSSEAPGNLIATLSGAKRRVGGQQNELCVPLFGL